MTAGEVLELLRDEAGLIFTAQYLLDFFSSDYGRKTARPA
jgi:hypothetical protein